MPTPFVVTVDTEEEWDWASGYPTGPTRVTNIARLPAFQDACDKHGAAVTYFVNHAVLADDASARVISELAARPRVEIGMHVHPWNTPPLQAAERVPVRDSFIHDLPPELALAKLNTVYDAFASRGLKPITFRGGRYSTSALVQQWLRERGFVADASILPYTSWTDDGAPNYARRAPEPVRTDAGLWELPLSLGFTRGPFGFWRRALSAASIVPKLVGALSKFGVAERAWLNFENPLGARMPPLIRALLKRNVPYLCFTLHSSSLLPGGSPYAPNESAVAALLARLSDVLARCAADPDLEPATVAEIASRLESQQHARHRDQPAG
jgi:hypothetical protein